MIKFYKYSRLLNITFFQFTDMMMNLEEEIKIQKILCLKSLTQELTV